MAGMKGSLQRVLDGRAKPPPIATTLGIRLLKYQDGKATMSMAVGKKFHNPMGTLHGGIMTDIADATMGTALASTLGEGETFTTLELKMNFLRPVYSGKLVAEGTVTHRGKSIALVECVVKDTEGRTVAKGVSTQMILKSLGKS